VIFDEEKPKSS
ncbi:hypothetical protein Tco_0743563, partial [Tanacetum coccineum]